MRRAFLVAAIAATFSFAGYTTASARVWKPTPEALAQDYAMIQDRRADGELLSIIWFAPTMLRPNSPGVDVATQILKRYIIIAVARGHLERATGSLAFDDPNISEAKNATGKKLTLLPRNDLPPTAISMLAGMEGMFQQSLGAMGRGMKIFVFDAADVDACNAGMLAISLAGETYTWKTPMPGCPNN
jgi:hypothetical protein